MVASEFEEFWRRYPRRVGKLAALKAYQRARTIATAAEILAGLENYNQHLPVDVQFIAHAATFLNQGRWMDEYEIRPLKIKRECPHEPPCHSPVWCDAKLARERGEAV